MKEKSVQRGSVADILLIDHPLSMNERDEPLAFGMLTAYLEERGFQCRTLGFYNRNIASALEVPISHIMDHLQHEHFRVLGMSLSGFDMLAPVHELAKAAKIAYPDRPFVVGGFFTTFYPFEILEHYPAFDFLIVGDGEKPLCALLSSLEEPSRWPNIAGLAYRDPHTNDVHYNPAGPQENLDQLPIPSTRFLRGMVNAFGPEFAIAGLCTSKGCRFNCSFCSVAETSTLLSPRQRRRKMSVTKVIRNLAAIVDAGAHIIRVVDVDFIGGEPERAAAIAQAIIERGWDLNLFIDVCFDDLDQQLFRLLARAGFNGLVGIESLSIQDRRLFRKGKQTPEDIYAKMEMIEATGFHLYSSFILYNPQTTLDDLELNLTFIRRFRRSYKCKTFFTYLRVDKSPFLSDFLESRGLMDRNQAERYASIEAVEAAVPQEEGKRLQLLLPYSLDLVPEFLHEDTAFVFHSMYRMLYWTWFYQFRMILYHNMDRSRFLYNPPTESADLFLEHSNALFDLCAEVMKELIDRARRREYNNVDDLVQRCENARCFWREYVEQEALPGASSPYVAVYES